MKTLIGCVALVLGVLVLRYRGKDTTPGMRWMISLFLWNFAVIVLFGGIPLVMDISLIFMSVLGLLLVYMSIKQGEVGSGGVTISRKRSPLIFILGCVVLTGLIISYLVEGVWNLLPQLR